MRPKGKQMSSSQNNKSNQQEAFLIVDGSKVFTIDSDDFSIGRKMDNDIILDSAHVSRVHAKIRYINKRYVLFDLKSTVGTSINGTKINVSILKSGDVISIGGVPIIFGLGSPETFVDASQPIDTNTGPTDSTDIDELDSYMDMFRDKE
jgi:pSer/pThr/pTyr-binding forkhead associated (FHA) protein